MATNFKGKVSIAGKEYNCEVVNGIRYIDGVTVSEFAKRLSSAEILELAMVGACAVDSEKENRESSPGAMYREIRNQKN